jgi:predicted phage tail protein
MLDSQEATKFIIRGLSRFGHRHDLTREVCERYRIDWDEANKLIARVEAEHKHSIEARRGGTLNVFAIIFIIIGVFLMAGMFISPFLSQTYATLGVPIPTWRNVVLFLTGLGMTMGGLVQLLKLT